MKIFIIAAIALILAACNPIETSKVSMIQTAKDAVLQVTVVYESVPDAKNTPKSGVAIGSAFLIDENLIVTNNHVVTANPTEINFEIGKTTMTVSPENSNQEYGIEVVAASPMIDLALVKMTDEDWNRFKVDNPNWKTLKVTDHPVLSGQDIFAIGAPWGMDYTVTQGIVSNTERIFPTGVVTYVQADINIYHGNSGGPLLNSTGEVIGVNTLLLFNPNDVEGTDPQLMMLSIGPDTLKKAIFELKQFGQVRFTVLGIALSEEKDHKYTKVLKLTGDNIGINVGDYIVSVAGKEVVEPVDVKSAVLNQPYGSNFPVVVIRDGKEVTLDITPKWMSEQELAEKIKVDMEKTP